MTDLEMTKLAAEAMGYKFRECTSGQFKLPPEKRDKFLKIYWEAHDDWYSYAPLHDDAQAMALEDWLIERGELIYGRNTMIYKPFDVGYFQFPVMNKAMRRAAIVECVAKMQASRRGEIR